MTIQLFKAHAKPINEMCSKKYVFLKQNNS